MTKPHARASNRWPLLGLLGLLVAACESERTDPPPVVAEASTREDRAGRAAGDKAPETATQPPAPQAPAPPPVVPVDPPAPKPSVLEETDNASDPSKPPTYTIAELERVEPSVLPEPPWEAKAFATVAIAQGTAPTLKQLSKVRNAIIDDEAWWLSHGVELPIFVIPRKPRPGFAPPRYATPPRPVTLPPEVPLTYKGRDLDGGYDYADYDILTYGGGQIVVVMDAKQEIVAALDFEQWTSGPAGASGIPSRGHEVSWAAASNGVLFVAVGYNGYAADSGGKTGYISALDLATHALLWRSEPLVSFANTNFLLIDGWIISGYGFTNEDDYLFLLDATNGSVAKRIKLKSGPDHLIVKDDRLLVRTYDTNYEFSL